MSKTQLTWKKIFDESPLTVAFHMRLMEGGSGVPTMVEIEDFARRMDLMMPESFEENEAENDPLLTFAQAARMLNRRSASTVWKLVKDNVLAIEIDNGGQKRIRASTIRSYLKNCTGSGRRRLLKNKGGEQ